MYYMRVETKLCLALVPPSRPLVLNDGGLNAGSITCYLVACLTAGRALGEA
jgi:hypothetical protein